MKIKEVLLTVTECVVLVAIIGFLTWFAVSKTSNTYEEEAIIMEAGSSSGSNTFTITYYCILFIFKLFIYITIIS